MGPQYQILFEALPLHVRDALLAIPGVRAKSMSAFTSPENAIGVVDEILRRHEIAPVSVWRPSWLDIEPHLPAIPELREWVPAFLAPFQREALSRFIARPSGLVFHPAGAGKTLTAIAWALARPGPIIVVTKSAVRAQWAREVQRFSTVVPRLLVGREDPKCLPFDPKARMTILGWETLPAWLKELSTFKQTSIVFDELHKGKSHTRWEAHDESGKVKFSAKENIAAAAMRLSQKAARRLGTTATPVRDRQRDLWAQLDLLEPFEWGTYWVWAERYCAAHRGEYGMDDKGASNLDEFKKRFDRVTHYVPYSVTHRDLPAKRRISTYVSAADLLKNTGYTKADFKNAARHGATALLELRLAEAAARKQKAVIAAALDCAASKGKCVVFTVRRRDVDAIAAALRKELAHEATKDIPVWSATGDQSPEAREEIRAQYMAQTGGAVLVGTGDAWGEGLNLQSTDVAVIAGLPYTPGQVIQWEGRFARLGQDRPVLINYLIAEGTVDERVADILIGKLPAVAAIGDEEMAKFKKDFQGDTEEAINAAIAEILSGGSEE